MSVLNKAKGHFRDQLAGELNSMEVPEWETTIYWKNVATFVQEQKVIELHGKGELVAALVETLIQKALDKDGKPVFKNADRDVLMREVDPNVIIRVCTQINATKEAGESSLGN
jgi:hypothetical protein